MMMCAVTAAPRYASAGFILDHTDADDHGSTSVFGNQTGWLYMQRVLGNLSYGVSNGNQTVVQLGATNVSSSHGAYAAASNAFLKSSLPSSGWNWVNIDGVSNISTYLGGGMVSGVSLASTGIIQLDSDDYSTSGSTSGEIDAINAGAIALNKFLADGGSLHSMAQGSGSNRYGFLSTLLPGITFTSNGGNSLVLAAAGMSAFPGLTNSALSSGPYHGEWTGGLGRLPVVFTSPGGVPVGIGSASGSITNPGTVPEPGSVAI